jgi:hypothetical protein
MSEVGIYALRHRPTKKLYIGASSSLSFRELQWRVLLRADPKRLPAKIRALLPFPSEDWEFYVIQDGTGMSTEELQQAEQLAIDHVRTHSPDKLLNTARALPIEHVGVLAHGRALSLRGWERETGVARATIAARLKAGWAPEQAVGVEPRQRDYVGTLRAASLAKATVVVMDGKEMLTQPQAAARLGCRVKVLQRRLQRFRVAGRQAQVQLRELQVLAEKYRHV